MFFKVAFGFFFSGITHYNRKYRVETRRKIKWNSLVVYKRCQAQKVRWPFTSFERLFLEIVCKKDFKWSMRSFYNEKQFAKKYTFICFSSNTLFSTCEIKILDFVYILGNGVSRFLKWRKVEIRLLICETAATKK